MLMHTYTGSSYLSTHVSTSLKVAFQKAGESTYDKFLQAYMCAQ